MQYRELKEKLNKLTEAQLDDDVTLVDLGNTETYPVVDFVTDWNSPERSELGLDIVDGVLDDGHVFFTF